MGKGSQTTTSQSSSTTAPNPQAGAAYSSLLTQAGNVAATPYQAYQGELTAPVNAQQQTGIGGINNYANFAQPYIQQAAGLATQASTPLTSAQIGQYQSPYTQDVVNATQNQFNNQNAQQQQQVLSNAAAQGALGGNRVGVTQGIVAGQQQAAQAPVIAGLENQGYQTGLSTALAEQQAQAQGAYSLGALGTAGQNAGLTGAGAQVGAGTLQQGTQQAQDTAAYQQYMQQLAYPFQTTQWLAGVDTGVGSQLGGTSSGTGSTTGPAPSYLGQALGLGIAGAGLFGSSAGGTSAAAGLASFLSSGGAVGRAFGGVAPDPEPETAPESHDTIRAQQKQLIDGHRRVHMFPHGTPELNVPRGMSRVEASSGVFHYDPKKINPEQIKHLAAHGRENEMLDLGPFSKDEVISRVHRGEHPLAVVERQPDGTEVRAAVGTHTTANHQIAAMQKTKSPGNSIHVEDIRHTLAKRVQRAHGGLVPGFDTGGSIGGTPWAGSSGWVPTIGISAGHGAPTSPGQAPNASNPNAGQPNPLQTATQAMALSKALSNGFGAQQSIPNQIGNQASGFGMTGAGGMSAQDVAGFPSDWGVSDPSSVVGGAGDMSVPTFKRGGGIRGYDSGGSPDTIPLDFNPGISGFGASPGSFDMRYAAVDPTLNPATMALAPYQSSGFDNPPPAASKADQSAVAGNPTFDERFSGEPQAPAPLSTGAAPMSVPTSSGFAGQQAPLTGTQAIPSAPAQDISAPTQGYADNMTRYANATKAVESNGGNYQATGPITKTGDRAYGAYQVMGFNIPRWTAEVLGKPMTPSQFLASPEVQDAVYRAKFGQLVNKYGPEGAARAWFAGEGGMNDPNATDGHSTVGRYSRDFMAALNGKPQSQVAGLDNSQNSDQADIPSKAQPVQQQGGLSAALSRNPELWPALMQAGFAMMASRSPFPGVAIGEGAQQGMQTYYGMKNQEQTQALNQRKVDIEAQKLSQSADQAAKNLALKTEQFKETQSQHGVENMKPVQIGQGILGPIYGIRDPKSGTYRVIDPKTGQVGPVVQPGTPGTAVPPADTSQSSSTSQTASVDDDATLPAGAQPRTGQVLRNEAFLSDLKKQDPGVAAMVQGIANYDLDPSKVTSLKGGQRERIVGLVMQYDPSFSLPFYASRAAAVKEFNAGGPNSPAGTITSGNTAIQHLGELSDYGEKLGGTSSYGILNKPINYANETIKSAEQDPDYKRYQGALGRFAEEATKFYRGVGGTESDIQRAIADVSAANGPEARRAAIAEQARLMQSKINALQDRYKTAMGGPPGWQSAMRGAGEQFPIVQQHSADSMKRILDREAQNGAPDAAPAAQPSGGVDPRDVAFLKSNPNAAASIDKKYGAGTAAKLLSPQ